MTRSEVEIVTERAIRRDHGADRRGERVRRIDLGPPCSPASASSSPGPASFATPARGSRAARFAAGIANGDSCGPDRPQPIHRRHYPRPSRRWRPGQLHPRKRASALASFPYFISFGSRGIRSPACRILRAGRAAGHPDQSPKRFPRPRLRPAAEDAYLAQLRPACPRLPLSR